MSFFSLFRTKRSKSNLKVAMEAVISNSTRSILTGLGVLFGVAAVISMLAIGRGAEKEIIKQIKQVGSNNIMISSIEPLQASEEKKNKNKSKNDKKSSQTSSKTHNISPGLTLEDALNIKKTIPTVVSVSPEVVIKASVIKNRLFLETNLIGITNDYFKVFDFDLSYGSMFTSSQLINSSSVCIIGETIRKRMINVENPIGSRIKCNNQWLTIVGVLKSKELGEFKKDKETLGIRDYNMDIYIPLQTMLVRFENRLTIHQKSDRAHRNNSKLTNYHQLDKLVVKLSSSEEISNTAELIHKILKRRHLNHHDYNIIIPEKLLRQQQKAKRLFTIILAVIASVSLLVGGIGIMNIMLASVLERIKEIGLRLALGAHSDDIIQQFLFESIIISVAGGTLGVLLGVVFSISTTQLFDIETEITVFSIALSFIVAVTVGLVFGIVPARNASRQNPINSLRRD